jgi:predicted SprT family Zn-dependent metalloprotease
MDTLRAQYQAGDRVQFGVGTATLHGSISRVNPRYAHVVCDDNREYHVPYARLTLQARHADAASHVHQRTQEALEAIAARASAWLATHRLTGWSFQFDHAAKRAGCCNYQTRVISLAYAYARAATNAEIDEALLHEIAHALVGQAHGHDHVWQAQAVALGCSGRRCHDVQFTPPRYIVTCANACWVTTAERRQRGTICRTCQNPVHYTTYTEERWQQTQGTVHSKEGSFDRTRGASDPGVREDETRKAGQ